MRALFCAVLLLFPSFAGAGDAELASRVRAELAASWHAYEQYAWGHDELRPVSKTPRDWYADPLLMTPVDALDTMLIMGLDDEASWVDRQLARFP